ncbi:MAG: peptidylprolyl isomerase [Bacteroidota bacterium]|nr:peptidylprolyl isomerase [Bacteroidota bacterium]MDP4229754.1 peptidylprolyl isomerase [Bacteroidota bacterium]MDP4236740.1 peptidylprolyl isomerase [Bacteroidota bacterium]
MVRYLKSIRPIVFGIGIFLLTVAIGYISSTLAQKEASKSHTAPSAVIKSAASPVLIKTTKEEIRLDEFEEAYRRMNDKDPYGSTLDSLKDFMTIYSDYRLKLLEAKELKLDQDPKIQKEIEGYRAMLAGPFVLDKTITEPNVHRIWEHRQWEVNVAHFLAAIKNSNDPADTLRAYKKVMKALARMNEGESIGMVVLSQKDAEYIDDPVKAMNKEHERKEKKTPDSTLWEGSDDHNSAKMGGELGYFTGGQTVRPFEEAAYSLKVGEYTKVPVRTRYGYHIIQLLDKHPRLGGLKVHHILVSMNKSILGADTMRYYHDIDSLYKAIKAGAKFEDVARQSSDDKFTAEKGGDLDFIDREVRRTEKPFDQTAYSLKDGEMSGIIRTSKGYHIIRRDGSYPPKTYDQEKDMLKKLYKQYYFMDDRAQKLAEVKKQNNAHIEQSSVNIFMSRVDSTRTSLDTGWSKKFTMGERNLALYKIGENTWNIGSLIDSLNAQPGAALSRNSILDLINKDLDDEAIAIMAKDVSKRFPEFEKIMADYKNGITLFELENKRIWSKVVPDSAKERKYFEEHKARFMWPERVDVSEIYLYNDSIAKVLYKRIINGENFDSLAKKYTERPGFKEKAGHWGLMTKDENEMSKKAFSFTVDDVREPFSFQSGFSIVKLNRRVPITAKTYEEAKQEVASQYQDELSNELRLEWVSDLRKKYKRQINTKVIEEAWKAHHSAGGQSGATSG